jgi:hypothetical protein
MKTTHLLALLLLTFEIGNAQAVPFLQFVPSPEGNGMGGIVSPLTTNDPFALIGNPAQVGMQSLSRNFGAGFFSPRSNWLPFIANSGITYTADAAFAGIRLNQFLEIPFDLSVGLGYSYTQFDMEDFYARYFHPATGGAGIPEDHANGYTLGIGIDCGIKVGIGATVRNFRSTFAGFVFASNDVLNTANGTAYDYGVIVSVPVTRFIPGSKTLVPGIKPVLDVNFSAGRDNVGNMISYADAFQTDPLPRIAYVGVALQAGVLTNHYGFDWNAISLTIARQGEDVLVWNFPNGTPYYVGGFGDLNFFRNVIGGRRTDRGGVRKGVEVSLGEFISFRKGSFDLYSYGQVSTVGYGLRLRGILNAIEAAGVPFPDDGVIGYFLHHIDIGYDRSKYASSDSGLDQTTFSAITVGLR